MKNVRHKLTEVSTSERVATCSWCGLVDIKLRKKDYWRCGNAVRANRRGYPTHLYTNRPKQCEVCGRESKICWDHNHTTGEFRGWLCDRCNLVIGRFENDPDTLRKLAEYLKERTPRL